MNHKAVIYGTLDNYIFYSSLLFKFFFFFFIKFSLHQKYSEHKKIIILFKSAKIISFSLHQ